MAVERTCPNCGSIIPSLSFKCVACGYVFSQETESSEIAREAIERLQTMLKDIDVAGSGMSQKKRAVAKSTIITTFVVPNTKEAMVNFLVLAFSNIESSSETEPQSITMAWEARAISTYNLLKLQQDEDPQIEAVLQKYSVLENKRKLKKIDGRYKRKVKKRKIALGITLFLALCSIPFVMRVVDSMNYDPVLAAINEGQYVEAVELINNSEELKQDVDFYLDQLMLSNLFDHSIQIDEESSTRTVTCTYPDGTVAINQSDNSDFRKNVEVKVIDPAGSVVSHFVDSLKLYERLWSIYAIQDSHPYIPGPIELYEADTLGVHIDMYGRCDTLLYAFGRDTTICSFVYDNRDNIIQQDIASSRDTLLSRVTSGVSVSKSTAFVTDLWGDDMLSQMNSRTYDSQYRLVEESKKFSLLGTEYIMHQTTTVESNRLRVVTHSGLSKDKLTNYEFDAELEIQYMVLVNPHTGKGVHLNFQNIME